MVTTESGVPTGFSFKKSSYGPFSSDVKPMITKLVNNGLVEEHPLGKMIAVSPGRTFADARKAFEADLNRWNDVIENVADLFMRIRTEQAEVAASVLFTARTLPKPEGEVLTESDVFQAVLQWKIRRNPRVPQRVPENARVSSRPEWSAPGWIFCAWCCLT
jgi:hypothetical protein